MNFFKILWCAEHPQSVAEAVAEAWVSVNETDDFFSASTVDIDGGGVDVHAPFRTDSVKKCRDNGWLGGIVGIDMLFDERHSQRVEQHAFANDGGIGHAGGRGEFTKGEGIELEDGIENGGYGECSDDDEQQTKIFFRGRIVP